MAYKGKFTPKNKEKYIGDIDDIVYRSLWERQTMKWLDENPNVLKWGSECTVIPYFSKIDQKIHRYFTDFYIELSTGETLVVEVKPEKQTQKPNKPKSGRKTRRFINESMTYVKNQSKWNAARQYCSKKGYIFQIWTEKTLKSMGIKILGK